MTNSIGVDISGFQSSVPAGPWMFIVHKATEGTSFVDPQFVARFPSLDDNAGLRGAYHYARPEKSSGTAQADFFANTVLAAGFVPGQDLWQLDCEGTGNESVDQPTWQNFIVQFMTVARTRLGPRGFLYGGYSFLFQSPVNAPAGWCITFDWWDADYGVNDGAVNAISAPEPYRSACVVHQFTSKLDGQSLDGNVINNAARWDALFAPKAKPPNLKVIARLLLFIRAVTARPLRRGDKGPNVLRLNQLLLRYGYAVSGDGYDDNTAVAIGSFKLQHKLKNRDANVCGGTCILALLKGKP